MPILTTLTLALSLAAPLPAPSITPPETSPRPADFDFWLGQWTVTNTRLDRATGEWNNVGTSHARIRPVAGGRAILEEWNGLEGPIAATFGMSLRYFDPDLDRWVIWLNWPGGPNPNPRFSQMQGGFFGEGDDARGEFFPPPLFDEPGPEPARRNSVRFTFSEPRADSCQWDMATPDANGTFNTTWIMKFARTGSPEEAAASVEVAEVPDTCPCTADAARALDALHGNWAGTGRRLEGGEWTDASATLFSTPAVRGCVTFHELTESVGEQTLERFEAWAFDRDDEEWGGIAMQAGDPRATLFASATTDEFVADPLTRADDEPATRTRYTLAADGSLTLELESRSHGEWNALASYNLTRDD